jgi:(2Fe-2S) ferredoxin
MNPTQESGENSMAELKQEAGLVVKVCMGTGGIAAGGQEVLAAFQEQFATKNIAGTVGKRCGVNKVGCRGFCAKDVLVDVVIDGETTTYQFVKPDAVAKIVDEHILGNEPVQALLTGPEYANFHAKQKKILLANCGHIDPEDIDAALDIGAYRAADTVLSTMTPDEVIKEIKDSGLRGRGGASQLA